MPAISTRIIMITTLLNLSDLDTEPTPGGAMANWRERARRQRELSC